MIYSFNPLRSPLATSLELKKSIDVRQITLLLVCTCFIWCNGIGLASDNKGPVSEEYVKALYIIQLTQFVSWPEEPAKHRICHVGDDSQGANLVQVRQELDLKDYIDIQQKDLLSDLKNCTVLYISKYAEFEAQQILFKISDTSILTISDTKNFIDDNGDIGFVKVNNNIKIEINNNRLRQKNIIADSDLLNIARRVL